MTHELSPIALVIEARKEAIKPDVVKLRKLAQKPGYFKARTPEIATDLLPVVALKVKEMKDGFDKIAEGNESFEEELNRIPMFLRRIGRSNHRRALEDIVILRVRGITGRKLPQDLVYSMWGETEEAYRQHIPEGSVRAARNATRLIESWLKWQALSDLPEIEGLPNPYDPVMDLLALGCANIGAVENTITADIPLIIEGHNRMLGCWQETDRGIRFTHNWESLCNQAVPVQKGQLHS